MTRTLFVAWVSLLLLGGPASALAQDHLEIKRAEFVPAEVAPGDIVALELEIEIKPGWHLYGSLETTGTVPSIQLGEGHGLEPEGKPGWPAGMVHGEGTFASYWVLGTATYRQAYVVPDDASGALTVSADFNYMACTERMCDPPTDVPFDATLTVSPGAKRGPPPPPKGPGKSITETSFPARKGHVALESVTLIGADDEVLSSVSPGEEVTLRAVIRPDIGWHVYGSLERVGKPPRLVLDDGSLMADGPTKVPAGMPHSMMGSQSFWLIGNVTLNQKVRVPQGAAEGEFAISGGMVFTACDERMCDPELTIPFTVLTSIKAGGAPANQEDSSATPEAPRVEAETEELGSDDESADGGILLDPIGADLDEGGAGGAEPTARGSAGDVKSLSWMELLWLAVGAGLFALVMPCTYPMIPITISFFTKQASKSGGSPISLSLAYGLGIVGIFIALGLAASSVIVPFAQHPITNLVIGIAFVVFALSLFGMINLQPPQFLLRTAAQASTRGGFAGVFLMGATLVVTSFTCTAPFVGTLLSSVASAGYLRVAAAMGVFGLTMAIPFVALSLMPSQLQRLPKSGDWMNTLKVTFGFIELAAALKFFSNAELVWGWHILPRELFLVLWAGIFFVAALFLLGQIKLKGDSGEIGPGRLLAGLGGLLLCVYFAYGSLGYSLDNKVMLAFEPPYTAERKGWGYGSGGSEESGPREHTIIEDDYDLAVQTALQEGKEVLVNFTGHS